MAGNEDDYDDDLYYEEDYLYVEDAYDVADELAETSVPSPPMMERMDEELVDGYDNYDYWMDIEYGSDEIYDIRLAAYAPAQLQKAGLKRKVHSDQDEGRPKKKQRTASGMLELERSCKADLWQGPNVVYRPMSEFGTLQDDSPTNKRRSEAYSLLPDWRATLQGHRVTEESRVRLSTQSKLQYSPGKRTCSSEPRLIDITEEVDGDDWQDSEDDAEVDEEGSEVSGEGGNGGTEAQLDPALLMKVLQTQLAGAGLDAEQIQQMLVQAMEHGTPMTDVLEKLTSAMLEHVNESGTDSGTGKWLRAQGVNFDRADSDVADGETGGGVGAGQGSVEAPADGAAELENVAPPHLKKGANAPESSKAHRSTTGRKRKAGTVEGDHGQPAKRGKGPQSPD